MQEFECTTQAVSQKLISRVHFKDKLWLNMATPWIILNVKKYKRSQNFITYYNSSIIETLIIPNTVTGTQPTDDI